MNALTAYIANNTGILIVLTLVLAITVWTLRFSWRRINGTQRGWTMAPPIPFQISGRNTWPFMVFCFSLAIIVVLASYPFEVAGWEEGRQFMFAGPFWIPWIGVFLSFFYWPLFLTPRWYREWVRHPDYPDHSPWPAEEVVHVLKDMEPGKKRDRMIKDMGWAGVDIDQAWKELGVPGSPPEEWWEKMGRRGDQKEADMGITDDMTFEEKVKKRTEHRLAQKEARKRAKEERRGR